MDADLKSERVRFWPNKLFWIGLVVFGFGSRPLLTVITAATLGFTSDPNPNPVLFGMMAMFTFWPGLIALVVGLVQSIEKYRAETKSSQGSGDSGNQQ